MPIERKHLRCKEGLVLCRIPANNILGRLNNLSFHSEWLQCMSLYGQYFSCDQAALWMVQPVRPSVRSSVSLSVCLSVRHTFFSGVITNDRGKVHAKGQGQRSRVKVTEVTNQLNRFRTVTPVLIHKWWWNDAWCPIVFQGHSKKFQGHTAQKNRRIWPRLGVSRL